MKLVIKYDNGKKARFYVDDYSVDKDKGLLRLFRENLETKEIPLDKIRYWWTRG